MLFFHLHCILIINKKLKWSNYKKNLHLIKFRLFEFLKGLWIDELQLYSMSTLTFNPITIYCIFCCLLEEHLNYLIFSWLSTSFSLSQNYRIIVDYERNKLEFLEMKITKHILWMFQDIGSKFQEKLLLLSFYFVSISHNMLEQKVVPEIMLTIWDW